MNPDDFSETAPRAAVQLPVVRINEPQDFHLADVAERLDWSSLAAQVK